MSGDGGYNPGSGDSRRYGKLLWSIQKAASETRQSPQALNEV